MGGCYKRRNSRVIVAITGHRPDRLPLDRGLYEGALATAFEDMGVSYVYEGQAPGADLLSAEAAFISKIPFTAVVPWKSHRSTVASEWIFDYDSALHFAYHIETLSDSERYLGPWMYHNRNKYMVDHADAVLALWDGNGTGGTASTVRYALATKKRVYAIDPLVLGMTIVN